MSVRRLVCRVFDPVIHRALGLAVVSGLVLTTGARAQFPSPSPSPSLTPNLQIPAIVVPSLTAYAWECRGPFETSGAIRQVIVDPVNDHRLYAAAENGGTWVLDDDQTTAGWRPLSDQLENLQMRAVVRSPSDAQFVAVANQLGFVYHTLDQGGTWTKTSSQNFQYIRRMLLTESNALVASLDLKGGTSSSRRDLWVVTRNGLFRIRFSDGVVSAPVRLFPPAGSPAADALDLAIDPSDASTMFLGVRGQGVWRTRDTGATWKLVATTAQFGDKSVATSGCVACGPSTMLKLAVNPSRVVAKFGRNVVTSDAEGDSGSWHACAAVGFRAEDDGGSDIGYRGSYTGQRGDWVHAIAIHPTNKDLIFAAQTALFVSSNGGASWTQLSGTHEDIQSLAFSKNGDRLYISTDGGVFRRTIATSTTDALNRSLTTLQFFRMGLSGSAAVGDADHQGIRGTRDVEANPPVWEFATTGASGFGNDGLENDHVYADPQRPNRYLVAFESRDVLRLRYPRTGTTEDLLPLNQLNAAPRPFTLRTNEPLVNNQLNYPVGAFAFDPREDARTILVTSRESSSFGIRITHDGDAEPHGGPRTDCGDTDGSTFCMNPPLTGTATWTRSHGPVATPIVSLAFAPNAGKAYALDEAGAVLVKDDVDDDAAAWRAVGSWSVPSGDFARQIVADVATPRKLYAMSHRKLVVSTDDGASWTALGAGSLPAVKFNCFAQHPTIPAILYLATDTDVLVSNNGGATWITTGGRLPNAPVMQLHTRNGYVWAVTFGRGLWRARMPS